MISAGFWNGLCAPGQTEAAAFHYCEVSNEVLK